MPVEQTVVDPPETPVVLPDTPAPPPPRRSQALRRLAAAPVALCAAWGVPVAAVDLDARWALPPLVLLATASLLRGGRTLLDRLLLAALLLVGVTTAAGTLFAVWPWGMDPVAVSGTALTTLTVAALVTGRRPALPRPAWVDVFPVLGTAAGVWYVAQPLLRADDPVDRYTMLIRGEDYLRHLALVDVISRHGGHVFVDPAATRDQIASLLTYYPQGWHLLVALLDGHLHPAGRHGVAAVEPFLWWNVAGFGLLVLTLLWAAQRLPGPLHPLHRGVLTVVVGSLVLGTQLPRLLISGYPTETLGLTLTVALAALVARPVAAPREHLVLLGALLTGIGFSYYLFLPAAALMVLGALVAQWRTVRRVRWTAVSVALVAAALAPTPLLLGVFRADQTEALTSTVGPDLTETWLALGGLGALVVPALVVHAVRARRADAAWRRWLFVLAVSLALTLAIAQASIVLGGEPGYYFNKAGHLTTALLIVGFAAVVRLLPTPRRDRGPARRAVTTVVAALTAAVVAVTAVALCGVTGWHRSLLVVEQQTWAQRWVHQQTDQPSRAAVVCEEANRRFPAVDGVTTIVLDRSALRSYAQNVCLSTLQGTTAQTEIAIYDMIFSEPGRTWQILHRVPGEIRFVVTDPGPRTRLKKLMRDTPDVRDRVTVVEMFVVEPLE